MVEAFAGPSAARELLGYGRCEGLGAFPRFAFMTVGLLALVARGVRLWRSSSGCFSSSVGIEGNRHAAGNLLLELGRRRVSIIIITHYLTNRQGFTTNTFGLRALLERVGSAVPASRTLGIGSRTRG